MEWCQTVTNVTMYKSGMYAKKAAVLPAGPSFKSQFITGAGLVSGGGTALGLLILAAAVTGLSVEKAYHLLSSAQEPLPEYSRRERQQPSKNREQDNETGQEYV